MKALALLLLCACFGGGHGLPDDVQPFSTDRNARRIETVGAFLSAADWERTPWWRPGDSFFEPVYIAVAGDKSACLVPAAVWAVAQRDQYVICRGSWRVPRP